MAGTTPDAELRFTCPVCGETLRVNPAMRDSLVEHGCVMCTSVVTADDFTGHV